MKKDCANLFLNNQNNWLKILGMLLFFISVNTSIYSQAAKPDKKDAEIKRLEMQLKTANMNLAKAEKAQAVNDSLNETGMKMLDEGELEFRELDTEQKKIDKEYAIQSKAITKRMNSKDKEDAALAKNEFKEADLKYKASLKDYANKKKLLEKKVTNGQMNLDKSKASRKMSEAALIRAKENKEIIEQKIEALKSGDESAVSTNNKGKKK